MERRTERREQILDEWGKVFYDTFSTSSGKRCLEILKMRWRAEESDLEVDIEEAAAIKRETMRRCYWSIIALVRRGDNTTDREVQV